MDNEGSVISIVTEPDGANVQWTEEQRTDLYDNLNNLVQLPQVQELLKSKAVLKVEIHPLTKEL